MSTELPTQKMSDTELKHLLAMTERSLDRVTQRFVATDAIGRAGLAQLHRELTMMVIQLRSEKLRREMELSDDS